MSISSKQKMTTPQSEWADPAVPEYESPIIHEGRDEGRNHAVGVLADAASSAENKAAAKQVVEGGVK